MPYLPELHYCHICGVDLGPDNGDGICGACDLEEDETISDDSAACPSCKAHMRQIGIDQYQCTRPTCSKTWSVREQK